MCGEKRKSFSDSPGGLGSPPRVRGKGLISGVTSRRVGITPACAGKRSSFQPKSACTRDHPRVCGEKNRGNYLKEEKMGSPPRVRGKATGICRMSPPVGITPACAGKSTKQEKHRDKAKDHPRVCGEKFTLKCGPTCSLGSPPRVRGKGSYLRYARPRRRITPACAGKRL